MSEQATTEAGSIDGAASGLDAGLGADARRELGKWLNERRTSPIDRTALAELCAAFDLLDAEVRIWRLVGSEMHAAGLRSVKVTPNALGEGRERGILREASSGEAATSTDGLCRT